jgi:hypothetical protein
VTARLFAPHHHRTAYIARFLHHLIDHADHLLHPTEAVIVTAAAAFAAVHTH